MPAMIRETNENVDELAQTTGKKKKRFTFKRAHPNLQHEEQKRS